MAKLAYSKLNSKINTDIVSVDLGDGKILEVRQYLPVEEKLDLIVKVIEMSHDVEHNFSNPLKTDVYLTIELIEAYTNITFTEKQKENPPKLYDAIVCSDWFKEFSKAFPDSETKIIISNLHATQEAYYKYRNSVMGILDNISTDYSDLDLDITKLQEKIGNAENIEFLKNVMTKLG